MDTKALASPAAAGDVGLATGIGDGESVTAATSVGPVCGNTHAGPAKTDTTAGTGHTGA